MFDTYCKSIVYMEALKVIWTPQHTLFAQLWLHEWWRPRKKSVAGFDSTVLIMPSQDISNTLQAALIGTCALQLIPRT
jgi:hypothetical protein